MEESEYKEVGKILSDDKDAIKRLMKKIGLIGLKYASEELQRDKEFIKSIIYEDSDAFQFVSEELKKDKGFILDIITYNQKKSVKFLKYVSAELFTDKEFVLDIIRQRKKTDVLPYINEEMLRDKDVILAFTKYEKGLECPWYRGSKNKFFYYNENEEGEKYPDWFIEVGKATSRILSECEELKGDKEFISEALKLNWYILKDVSEELKGDKDVVMQAIKTCANKFIIYREKMRLSEDSFERDRFEKFEDIRRTPYVYASEELKRDKEFVLAAIRIDADVLKDVDKELLEDKEFIKKMVAANYNAFKYVNKELREDANFVKEIVKVNYRAFQYADFDLINDKKFMLDCIKETSKEQLHSEYEAQGDNEEFRTFWEEMRHRTYKYRNNFFNHQVKKIAKKKLRQYKPEEIADSISTTPKEMTEVLEETQKMVEVPNKDGQVAGEPDEI